MNEQIAFPGTPSGRVPTTTEQEIVPRRRQSPPASPHRAGHYAGLHPEDRPSLTQPGRRPHSPYPVVPHTTEVDDEDDADIYPTRTRSSTIVRQRLPVPQRIPPPTPSLRRTGHRLFILGVVSTSLLIGVLGSLLLPPVIQRWQDQNTYGYPRTYQTDANVGHGDAAHPMSHFIALNNGGVIEVIELPGGDPDKRQPHLYLIAKLTQQDADTVPVTVSFADVNGDGKPDMEVTFNQTVWVFYNDGATFKPKL
jgi:hypothetical protein